MPVTDLHSLQCRIKKQVHNIHSKTARVVATNRDPYQVILLHQAYHQLRVKIAPRGKAFWKLMDINY
ncbi:hypothetical protein DNZ67_06725 [Salmonella enterica subsp. enterica serovar Typhimurium]|nr:hypothetical protein [Salmonella enterica subsp. enterica serovar Typhimurium]EBU9006923.1 hypothetical protein [Salmonella enterica subsp. enterica serovar Typhimurium]EBV2024430.1 hypothetical protein [Salmonella enterica subsp. enterica serovar Typhimurium]EBV3467492.1 hypothetical protein [Salmonella enterica subsp. enterica serovar Typhimurium]